MISKEVLATEFLGQSKAVNIKSSKVSVVVITYNHDKYISECLDSILQQNVDFNYEIILGEDNSTDNTRDICKAYAEKHPDRIRLFLRTTDQKIEVNGEKTYHFNFIESLNAAKGKYIAYCEGDDYWTDSLKLQKQVDFLENNLDYVLCSHNARLIDEKGNFIKVFNANTIKSESSIKNILLDSWYMVSASLVFRRNALMLPDWFCQIGIGDYLLQLLLTANGGKVHYINEVMSNYRMHEGGVSNQFKRKIDLAQSKIKTHRLFDIHTEGKYHSFVKISLKKNYYIVLQHTSKLSLIFWAKLYKYLKLIDLRIDQDRNNLIQLILPSILRNK